MLEYTLQRVKCYCNVSIDYAYIYGMTLPEIAGMFIFGITMIGIAVDWMDRK